MSFKCAECGWVVESGQRTAIEIHKLTEVVIGLSKSLSGLGILPEVPKTDTHTV